MSDAYFCLVTWPDGREGLLFPRPGNVAIATTLEQGQADFKIAVEHLKQWIGTHPERSTTKVALVRFERKDSVTEYTHRFSVRSSAFARSATNVDVRAVFADVAPPVSVED